MSATTTINKSKSKLSLSRLILEKISQCSSAMLEAFFPANYPETYIWRKLLGLDSNYKFSKDAFSSILSRLQKQGLIKRRGSRKKSLWAITPKGRNFLQINERREKENKIQEDGIIRVVCFDIPEKERRKRNIIRENLKNNHYIQLQQSVWVGKSPLTEDFLKLIYKLKINR